MAVIYKNNGVTNDTTRVQWKGIEVSEEAKLALLDFLCIHNSEDLAENVPIYELWYLRDRAFVKKESDQNSGEIVKNWT